MGILYLRCAKGFFFFLCRRKAGGDLDTTDVFQEYISLEKWLSSMVNQWLMYSREATLGYAQIRQVSTLSWTDARVHSNRAFNLDTKRSCWLQERCQERTWVAGAGCTESTWEPSSRVMPCPRTKLSHKCICFLLLLLLFLVLKDNISDGDCAFYTCMCDWKDCFISSGSFKPARQFPDFLF